MSIHRCLQFFRFYSEFTVSDNLENLQIFILKTTLWKITKLFMHGKSEFSSQSGKTANKKKRTNSKKEQKSILNKICFFQGVYLVTLTLLHITLTFKLVFL